MSSQFRRKILSLTLLPLPLVLAVCALLIWQISRQRASSQWVSHTREVLLNVYQCERFLIDQETGLRGFLYTADPRFLQPYTEGQPKFEHSLENLRRLTTDNPEQKKRIDSLLTGYQRWLARSLAARQTVTAQAPALCSPKCVAEALQRKQEMDEMRSVARQIEEDEQRLLIVRQDNARRAGSSTIAALVISLALLGVVLVVFMQRAIQRIDAIYSKALADRDQSVLNEQRARTAAEALAGEIREQSLEMEQLYLRVRQERDSAQSRLAELGHGR